MILNVLLFLQFYFLNVAQAQNPEWCWTTPDTKVKIEADKFGYNYGLCEESEEGSAPPAQKTKITVKMHDIKGFGGSSGPFKMRLSSAEIQGEEFILNGGTFKQDANYQTSIEMPSVGEIQTVEIFMDDAETGLFTCDNIIIEEGPKNYEFDCAGILDKKNKQMVLTKQDTIEYEVTMKAGKNEDDQSEDPIFIAIKGAKGNSEYMLFAEKGIQAEPEENTVEFPDLGQFQCLYVKSYGDDKLLLTSITMQAEGGEPIEFDNADNQVIDCPTNCQIAFCKGGSTPAPPLPPPDNDDEDAGVDDEDDGPSDEEESPYPETYKFNCAKLSVSEKEKMKSLGCKTTAEQIFDPLNYISANINYEQIYGICPPGCAKEALVQGRGIHSPGSTVCGAALVDGSIPKSGGCVSISRVKGLGSYPKGAVTNGIKVEMGSGSAWGFITFKADNPDFSKSDVRILNHKGEPDYQGRVEFRVVGKWGSVNFKGCEQSSAKFICKALNYIDGEWMNDPDEKDFCETYLDKDHCGFKGQLVHYMNYKCDGEVESLADCYREVSTEFNHKDDAIIKCSMVDKSATKEVQPKDGDVRIIGPDGSPSQTETGRVEMFYNKKWGTVCNKGFVKESADVVCKSLGFDGGKNIGEPGAFKACILGKEDYCEDEGAQMQAEGLKCTGSEKSLFDCGGNMSSQCSNFQSAMVKCDGKDGDTSGVRPAPDTPSEKTPGPKLGNLPLSNPYKLTCETTLNQLDFPGDPGSIYLANCPEGCKESDAILRGTSIYTYDSSICKAAIHSGVLQHKGGGITIIITYGQPEYEGSLNRQIESEKFKYSKKSFMIGKEVSIHKQWSLVNYFAPYLGLSDLHTKQPIQPPLKENPAAFIQLKAKTVKNSISQVAQNFRRYVQKTALLQLKDSKEKKLFEWFSKKNFVFSEKNKVDTSDLEDDDSLQQMKTFTILLQLIVEKDNGVVEIFGHSECQCWGLILDQDGLKFGSKCTDSMVTLGYYLAQEVKYHIAISYDEKSTSLILVVNGDTIFNDKIKFDFQCSQKVNIGCNSFSNSKFFLGKINYIQVLDKALPASELEERTEEPIPSEQKTPESGGDTPDGQKTFANTQDGRKCVSPCITDPFPEQPNAPEPPAGAALGAAPSGPGGEGASQNDDDDDDEDEEGKDADEKIQNPECLDIQCDDTLEKPEFAGEVGREICVFCPKACTKANQFVFGSQIYYQSSSICLAAIHDGKIQDKEGGEILVVLANPLQKYQGSHENDVNSKTLQTLEPTLSFTIKNTQKTFDLKCDTLGTDPQFADAVAPVKVKCPVQCSFFPNIVNGDQKYTDTSSLCQAAIHAGASTDNGGEFYVQFVSAQLVYDDKRQNQIISQKFDNSKEQVKRSMIFIVNKPQVAGYFFDQCDSEVSDMWDKIDDSGAEKGPGQWKYTSHPLFPEKQVLTQIAPINVKTFGKYATRVFHKEFDSDSALMKINVWQEKKTQFAIFVRYYDENNYYAFKFNTPEEQQIILVKRAAGVDKILGQYSDDLPIKEWMRLYIVFDQQVISLNMQQGDYRNVPKIISVVDPDVQRGKVGLGTNDEAGVFFDGITVKSYNINEGIMDIKSQNNRIWDQCLKPANLKHRETYCTAKNGNAKWAIPICKKIINYCDYCCTEIIPKWERIIHYTCQKTCVQSTRRHEQTLRNGQESGESKPYEPKKGDKIDYMNPKSKQFIPAIVKDVKNGEEDGTKEVTVSYSLANGEFMKETVEFPGKNQIKRCKEILKGRSDCE